MALVLVTAPTSEPVSVLDTKLHLRVDTTAEDDLIASLIVAGRDYAETFTHRASFISARIRAGRAPIWYLIVLNRVTVFVQDTMGILGFVGMASGSAEMQCFVFWRVECPNRVGVVRIVPSLSIVGIMNSETLEVALKGVNMVIYIHCLETVIPTRIFKVVGISLCWQVGTQQIQSGCLRVGSVHPVLTC